MDVISSRGDAFIRDGSYWTWYCRYDNIYEVTAILLEKWTGDEI